MISIQNNICGLYQGLGKNVGSRTISKRFVKVLILSDSYTVQTPQVHYALPVVTSQLTVVYSNLVLLYYGVYSTYQEPQT